MNDAPNAAIWPTRATPLFLLSSSLAILEFLAFYKSRGTGRTDTLLVLTLLHGPTYFTLLLVEGGRQDRKRSTMADGATNCIDILIAIILPPLGVFLKFGCGHEFWICLLLTFLGYIPGIIYAVYAITK